MVDASDLSSISQPQSTVHPYNDPPQTPERPSTKQKPGLPKVTARQKEALIENLKFESEFACHAARQPSNC